MSDRKLSRRAEIAVIIALMVLYYFAAMLLGIVMNMILPSFIAGLVCFVATTYIGLFCWPTMQRTALNFVVDIRDWFRNLFKKEAHA